MPRMPTYFQYGINKVHSILIYCMMKHLLPYTWWYCSEWWWTSIKLWAGLQCARVQKTFLYTYAPHSTLLIPSAALCKLSVVGTISKFSLIFQGPLHFKERKKYVEFCFRGSFVSNHSAKWTKVSRQVMLFSSNYCNPVLATFLNNVER